MEFKFNLEKTIQATAMLVKLENNDNGRGDYLRVLKLLYLADRKSIERYNRPITGDRIVAMDLGPVLSRVLDLINGNTSDTLHWGEFLSTDRSDLVIGQDPGDDELSPAEVEILQEVSTEFAGMTPKEVVNWTHTLSEWKNHHQPGTSIPIPMESILESVGRSGDSAELEEEAQHLAAFDNLLRSLQG